MWEGDWHAWRELNLHVGRSYQAFMCQRALDWLNKKLGCEFWNGEIGISARTELCVGIFAIDIPVMWRLGNIIALAHLLLALEFSSLKSMVSAIRILPYLGRLSGHI